MFINSGPFTDIKLIPDSFAIACVKENKKQLFLVKDRERHLQMTVPKHYISYVGYFHPGITDSQGQNESVYSLLCLLPLQLSVTSTCSRNTRYFEFLQDNAAVDELKDMSKIIYYRKNNQRMAFYPLKRIKGCKIITPSRMLCNILPHK